MQSVASIRTDAQDARCLGVHIDGADEPILVPLLSELPRKRFRELAGALKAINDGTSDGDADDIIDEFFGEYLGREVVDAMRTSDYIAIVRQWSNVSQEDAGATLGES